MDEILNYGLWDIQLITLAFLIVGGGGGCASFQVMKTLDAYTKPSKSIRLFEKVIEPMLLYNCEITKVYITHKWTYENFISNMWGKKMELNKVLENYIRE